MKKFAMIRHIFPNIPLDKDMRVMARDIEDALIKRAVEDLIDNENESDDGLICIYSAKLNQISLCQSAFELYTRINSGWEVLGEL
jgi:hypothetical protein